jgi:hypothetical protein
MKYKCFRILGAGLALIGIGLPLSGAGAPSKTSPSPSVSPRPATTIKASPSASPAACPASKLHAITFHGMIVSTDEKAKTFTIAGKEKSHSLKITDKTVVTKAGRPATIRDIVANEEVRGVYYKEPDGSMEARAVSLGPMTDAEVAAQQAHRQKRADKKTGDSPAIPPVTSPSASPRI